MIASLNVDLDRNKIIFTVDALAVSIWSDRFCARLNCSNVSDLQHHPGNIV